MQVGDKLTGSDGNEYEVLALTSPGTTEDGHNFWTATLKEILRAQPAE